MSGDYIGSWMNWLCSRCGHANREGEFTCYKCGQNRWYICSDYTTWPPFYLQGWECPRCKKINAPDIKQCTCALPIAALVNENGEWVEEED